MIFLICNNRAKKLTHKISFGEMLQILLLTDLPIHLQRLYDSVIDYLLCLIKIIIKLNYCQLYLIFLFRHLFFLNVRYSLTPRPHLHKIADILPDKAFVGRLVDRVKIVGMRRDYIALIDYLLFLLIDVLEVDWLIPRFEPVR